ncbi:hypothetical protein [Streptomyces sp. SID161]|uniref:hypothetical protein n=1 Tax=Streptomyces sp. SID161 TaxID=2690251 RepID=UPI00192769AD|nr:hypothetical protein [Streptomyces sp. SID161]
MSTVRARVWRFTIEKGKAGAEAVQAVEIGQGTLPVSLAAMVNINALACDLRIRSWVPPRVLLIRNAHDRRSRPPACRFAHQLSTAFNDTPNTEATSSRSRPATNAATARSRRPSSGTPRSS